MSDMNTSPESAFEGIFHTDVGAIVDRMSVWAFVPIVTGHGDYQASHAFGLGIAKANVAGYWPVIPNDPSVGYFTTYDEAAKFAEELNRKMGIDETLETKIVISSWQSGPVLPNSIV